MHSCTRWVYTHSRTHARTHARTHLQAYNALECKALEELSRNPRLAHFAPAFFGKHQIDDNVFMVPSLHARVHARNA